MAPRARRRPRRLRAHAFWIARQEPQTYVQIAHRFGVSVERARQLVAVGQAHEREAAAAAGRWIALLLTDRRACQHEIRGWSRTDRTSR